jgi:hypothetical protein
VRILETLGPTDIYRYLDCGDLRNGFARIGGRSGKYALYNWAEF